MRSVVGFVFDTSESNVLLIMKNRPVWQAGKLNGIGGKIEPGEEPLAAMRRECLEETGLKIDDWIHTITLQGETESDDVLVFAATYDDIFFAKSMTDELVEFHVIHDFVNPVYMHNLRWMIPVCLNKKILFPITVKEQS